MNITKEGLDEIVCLMVEDAVDLYINCYVNLKKIENGKRRLKNPEKTKRECLDSMTEVTLFFCSDYGEQLTGVDGKTVMEQLNKRAMEIYENDNDKYQHYRFVNKHACYRED